MGALVQCCYRVYTKNGDSWTYYTDNWPQDVNGNLLTNKTTSKISIQAPPGTVVQLNGKNMVIGRSGIFDFDNEDIEISSILFPAGIDNATQKVAADAMLTAAKGDLASDLLEDNITFCNSLKYQYTSKTYSTTVTPPGGQETTFSAVGIAGVIAAYQEAYDDIGVQNRDLKNIIVNYIEND